MIRSILRVACALLCVLPFSAPAQSPVDVSEVLQMRVLPGWRGDAGQHVAGLEMRLKPGWHTYWRSAGSLGISPMFNWQDSRNIRQVIPVWPAPKVFFDADGQSYGYDGTFVLPLVITTAGDGVPAHLAGQIDLGVCAEVCIPARVQVAFDLPAPGQVDPAIEAAMAKRPRQIASPARCRVEPSGKDLRLTAEIALRSLGGPEAVVFELPGTQAWITDANTSRSGGTLRAEAAVMGVASLERTALRVTVLGTRGAVEFTGCNG